ncbi:MAG: Protein of unknown function (DUF3298) [Clostridium sp. Maddingley MBC34-26]|nr:MAG: Protein of unknown function (DUF3298) [Clostridium sp. Maddingley MBC34-26]
MNKVANGINKGGANVGVLTNIAGIFVMGSMLFTIYPQQLCISSGLKSEKQLKVEEKLISKNLGYLKEDIKMPQFVDGNDKKKISLINNKINSDILPKVEEAEKTSKEYFKGIEKEIPRFPYEINSRYTVTEDNKSIISVFNDYYEFLGGAHGMTTKTSYTVDKEKEGLITLKDLFNEGYDYKDIINKEIKEQIGKNPENYFDSGAEFKGISDNQNFYIEDDNLVIYYQLYELAPYVFGFPEFKIPLKLFDENFVYYKDW